MQVLAALGDAPTAVIAVVAIVLGVVFVVRGPRGERGAAPDLNDEPTAALSEVPGATTGPAARSDGLQTMASGRVGHGTIRLGARPAAEPDPAAPALPAMAAPAPPRTPGTVPFRHGAIKLGRKPTGDPPADKEPG